MRRYPPGSQPPRVHWGRHLLQVCPIMPSSHPSRALTCPICRAYRKNNVFNYAVSVPWRKVRANEEVLLAWEMNGKPLPKIHGFPLRVVVTGYIGARSAKWVYKINALAEPSLGPVQSQEYLYYTQQVRTRPLFMCARLLFLQLMWDGRRCRLGSTIPSIRTASPFRTCQFRA